MVQCFGKIRVKDFGCAFNFLKTFVHCLVRVSSRLQSSSLPEFGCV